MADNKGQENDNLIDLARERDRAKQRGASKKPQFPQQKKSKPGPTKKGPKWYHYLQVVLFIGFLAFMMSLCQNPGS